MCAWIIFHNIVNDLKIVSFANAFFIGKIMIEQRRRRKLQVEFFRVWKINQWKLVIEKDIKSALRKKKKLSDNHSMSQFKTKKKIDKEDQEFIIDFASSCDH